jgi:hypothetical protein
MNDTSLINENENDKNKKMNMIYCIKIQLTVNHLFISSGNNSILTKTYKLTKSLNNTVLYETLQVTLL